MNPLEPVGNPEPSPGWRAQSAMHSLPEVFGSMPVPKTFGFWRKMLAFSGPGFLVAVGYMDPGNWATDLAAGSAFGYTLLFIILLSNLAAVLLQTLSARLGIATGRDLAQACRDHYSRRVSLALWILCELAICACDLAEVIGSAVALNLLFHIPILLGVCITSLDVIVVMFLQNKGFRWMEAFVMTLIATIGVCFAVEIFWARPHMGELFGGFLPRMEMLKNPEMIYLSIGILGATVMPHNLYLHSSIVQTRKYEQNPEGRREAIRFATLDACVALMIALIINCSILILSAATFHKQGQTGVAEIQDAYKLISGVLGTSLASTLFAVALLASGQSSTLTGTLAGQIVMEGFLNFRMRPWLRRLITRLIAIVPAIIASAMYGESGTAKLLVMSQVVLSLQLSFAVIPLVVFTSDRRKMGEFASPRWLQSLAWITTGAIILINIRYLLDFTGLSALLNRLFT